MADRTSLEKKTCRFEKNIEKRNKIILFVLSYLSFYPAIGKCYYLPILLNIIIGAINITHEESLKDNSCSIAMLIAVV